MRIAWIGLVLSFGLTGCGVETASTAASVAAAKAKEAEQAERTLKRVRTEVSQTERVLAGRADR